MGEKGRYDSLIIVLGKLDMTGKEWMSYIELNHLLLKFMSRLNTNPSLPTSRSRELSREWDDFSNDIYISQCNIFIILMHYIVGMFKRGCFIQFSHFYSNKKFIYFRF